MPRAPKPLFVLLLLAAPFLLLAIVTCGPLGRPGPAQWARVEPPVPFEISLRPTTPETDPAIYNLTHLTPAEAARLDGKRCRWRVTTAGPPDRRGDHDVYEALPENDPEGVLYLEAGPEIRDSVVVDAVLEVIHHPQRVIGPVKVAAFTEYRLVDAVRL